VVDHITAQSALVLPVAAIAAECRARGVAVLVDGAHAPGSIAVDIPAIGADWYAANLHKWAHAPRSCGILWSRPEHQATLHHPVVSWGSGRGFHAEFEHHATCDPTSYLAAPEGVTLLREWDYDVVLAYMHGLAVEAGRVLADRWETTLDTPDDMRGAMITVPLPEDAGTTSQGRTATDNATVRSVFVIGPDKKVKAMLTYPMSTGRNFDEVLRLLDSCQLTAKHKVATPVNWKQGQDVIIVPAVSDAEAKQTYPGGWKAPKPYLRIVPQPK